MSTTRTAATLAAGALALGAGITTATTAQAATPTHYQQIACKTTGKYANPGVHGTVKYGYRITNGKVVPVSSRLVGTTRLTNPQPKGRTQVWTYANASVSRDNGTAMHTSTANPVTYYASRGLLPKNATDTTMTGRWTVTVGGRKVATTTCTARINITAPRAAARPTGTKWPTVVQPVTIHWSPTSTPEFISA